MLVLSNGELVTVEWVQHEILESPIKVYNFEVEDFHTYFVGNCKIWVHNNDCVKKVESGEIELETKKQKGANAVYDGGWCGGLINYLVWCWY